MALPSNLSYTTNDPKAPGNTIFAADHNAIKAKVNEIITCLGSLSAGNFRAGSGGPIAATGENGEYYIDLDTSNVYGPKAGGSWPGTPTTTIGANQIGRAIAGGIDMDADLAGKTINTPVHFHARNPATLSSGAAITTVIDGVLSGGVPSPASVPKGAQGFYYNDGANVILAYQTTGGSGSHLYTVNNSTERAALTDANLDTVLIKDTGQIQKSDGANWSNETPKNGFDAINKSEFSDLALIAPNPDNTRYKIANATQTAITVNSGGFIQESVVIFEVENLNAAPLDITWNAAYKDQLGSNLDVVTIPASTTQYFIFVSSGSQFNLISQHVNDLSVIDQSASGYIDLGTTRIQWGNGTGTIIFPVAFANTNYSLTATPSEGTITNALARMAMVDQYTTTTARITVFDDAGGASGVGADWIAIGVKP